MPNKPKGKKAAAKAAAKAKKAKEKAQKEEALSKLDALVLKLRNESKDDKTDLFAEPPPAEDCPICMHPFPCENQKQVYMDCCGQMICWGCIKRHEKSSTCPFCRLPKSKSASGWWSQLKKRMQCNDARAFHQAYSHSSLHSCVQEEKGIEFSQISDSFALLCLCRAAELGLSCSIFDLFVMHGKGNDLIEKDQGKAMLFLEAAAWKGYIPARYHLGDRKYRRGNGLEALPVNEITIFFKKEKDIHFFDSALHFSMAAACGHKKSVDSLIEMQNKNIICEEDLTRSMSSYRQCKQEEWSEEREDADKIWDVEYLGM